VTSLVRGIARGRRRRRHDHGPRATRGHAYRIGPDKPRKRFAGIDGELHLAALKERSHLLHKLAGSLKIGSSKGCGSQLLFKRPHQELDGSLMIGRREGAGSQALH
jgi:hypothetical protein